MRAVLHKLFQVLVEATKPNGDTCGWTRNFRPGSNHERIPNDLR